MVGSKSLFIGAVLLVAMAANVQGVCKQLQCPKTNGYFAHPRSCVAYVKCVGGRAYEEKCPANLHYNLATGMCDQQATSNCVEEEKLRSTSCDLVAPSPPKLRSVSDPSINCDCGECCRKPNPLDCSSFYECDEAGDAYLKTCSEGLVYNPVKEDCDLASNYDCPEVPSCSCKCRYPVTGECGAFYKCEEVDEPVVKEYCSEGLLFNPDTEMCDRADNVDCSTDPNPPEPTAVPGPDGECKDLKTDCKFWVANGDCVCDTFLSGDCSWQYYVQNNCPSSCQLKGCAAPSPVTDVPGPGPIVTEGSDSVIDGCIIDCSKEQYHRHPSDCTKFIQCAPYGPAEMPCPANTRWDQDILTCNHASATDCVTGNYLDKDGNECGSGSGPVDPEPEPTSGPVVTAEPEPEPEIDGCIIDCSKEQYHRHPSDCTKFIQCAPYGPAEMPCPANTRWDQDILTCNHASATDCVTGNYLDKDGNECGSGPGLVDPEPEPEPTSGPVVTAEPEPEPEIDGCIIDCSKEQYHRHPSDCTKFIQCAPYGPAEMPCPANTRWDQDILTCNHASATDCVTGNYLDKDGNQCGSVPGPVDPDVPESCDDIQCPEANGEFAHPRDCTKWVHCSHSTPYVKDCPASLHFDPSLRVCNWPADAVCIANVESSCELPIPVTPTPGPDPKPVPEVCDCECCLRPHPEDCQSYYYCDGASTQFFTCGNGLVFHPENETCVHAEAYPECQPIVPPECECECRYPSTICGEYFQCVNDVPERKVCDEGLYYNPETFACGNPDEVDCTNPSKRSNLGPKAPAISADECKVLPDGRYANEANPDNFYHCASGIPFLLKCQVGGSFSQQTGRCEKK